MYILRYQNGHFNDLSSLAFYIWFWSYYVEVNDIIVGAMQLRCENMVNGLGNANAVN